MPRKMTVKSLSIPTQKQLNDVRDNLKTACIELVDSEISFVPKTTVLMKDDAATAGKISRLMDALESLDDVSGTHNTNFEFADGIEV